MLQHLTHYFFHFVFILLLAYFYWPTQWKKAYFILLATMLVDIDHLWATPIFDSGRCSIGFHLLHSYYAIGIYFILLFFPKTRIIGIGLTLHILTDFIDCIWIY